MSVKEVFLSNEEPTSSDESSKKEEKMTKESEESLSSAGVSDLSSDTLIAQAQTIREDLEVSDEESLSESTAKEKDAPAIETKELEALPLTERGPPGDSSEQIKSTKTDDVSDMIDVEDTDDYLLYLEDILKTIHKAYYELYDQVILSS